MFNDDRFAIFTKPVEFWFAVMAGALYIMNRHKDLPFFSRLTITCMSAAFGMATFEGVANWTGMDENIVAVILIASGYALLDILVSAIADRKLIVDLIRSRLGLPPRGNDE